MQLCVHNFFESHLCFGSKRKSNSFKVGYHAVEIGSYMNMFETSTTKTRTLSLSQSIGHCMVKLPWSVMPKFRLHDHDLDVEWFAILSSRHKIACRLWMSTKRLHAKMHAVSLQVMILAKIACTVAWCTDTWPRCQRPKTPPVFPSWYGLMSRERLCALDTHRNICWKRCLFQSLIVGGLLSAAYQVGSTMRKYMQNTRVDMNEAVANCFQRQVIEGSSPIGPRSRSTALKSSESSEPSSASVRKSSRPVAPDCSAMRCTLRSSGLKSPTLISCSICSTLTMSRDSSSRLYVMAELSPASKWWPKALRSGKGR